jgi:hypothetical protein
MDIMHLAHSVAAHPTTWCLGIDAPGQDPAGRGERIRWGREGWTRRLRRRLSMTMGAPLKPERNRATSNPLI